MIDLGRITAGYGQTAAVVEVDLRIAAGERVALLGPSGAGKTTLLRVIGGSLAPLAGTCRFDGAQTQGLRGEALREMRRRIATIHQRHDLVGRLSVARNVLAGRLGRYGTWRTLRTWCWPPASDLSAVQVVLERVGIAEQIWERSDRLSGGQQQRVAIARALYQEAKLLLADEPVSSLDPARAEDMLELLCRTSSEDQRTLVASLHQPELARRFFPRLVGVREGRIFFDLPTAQVDESLLTALFSATAKP